MKSIRIEDAPSFSPVDGAEMAIVGDGKKMTLCRIKIEPGAMFPDHYHPHEQIGTCIEGVGVLISGDKELNVSFGVTWTIPGGEVHRFEATGNSPVLIYEVWSPPREDYRERAGIA
jgi:quercetin dioxygenase-like cupin family protein